MVMKIGQPGVDRLKLFGERQIAENERMQWAPVEIAQHGIHGLGREGVPMHLPPTVGRCDADLPDIGADRAGAERCGECFAFVADGEVLRGVAGVGDDEDLFAGGGFEGDVGKSVS